MLALHWHVIDFDSEKEWQLTTTLLTTCAEKNLFNT